jgi:hypothetical protein
MFPAILQLAPELARSMVEYRFEDWRLPNEMLLGKGIKENVSLGKC